MGCRIAIIDLAFTGHHPGFLRLCSEAMIKLGHEVTIFCPRPEELKPLVIPGVTVGSPCCEPAASTVQGGLAPFRVLRTRRRAIRRLRYVRDTVETFERQTQQRFDLLFFAFMDQIMGQYLTAWDGDRHIGRPFSGLYFHPWHLRVPLRWPYLRRGPFDPVHILRSRYCRAVAVFDEGVRQRLSQTLGGKPVIALPDSVPAEEEAGADASRMQELRRKANGRLVIGLLGPPVRRKGTLDFISLSKEMAADGFFFLIAGRYQVADYSPQEQKLVEHCITDPPENLMFLNARLPDDLFNSLFRACDIIFAAYHDFPSSSHMPIRCAMAHIPCLVSKGHLMEERVSAYSLGMAVPQGDVDAMAKLLRSGTLQSLAASDSFRSGCDRFAQSQSRERQTEMLRQLLDCISDPA